MGGNEGILTDARQNGETNDTYKLNNIYTQPSRGSGTDTQQEIQQRTGRSSTEDIPRETVIEQYERAMKEHANGKLETAKNRKRKKPGKSKYRNKYMMERM